MCARRSWEAPSPSYKWQLRGILVSRSWVSTGRCGGAFPRCSVPKIRDRICRYRVRPHCPVQGDRKTARAGVRPPTYSQRGPNGGPKVACPGAGVGRAFSGAAVSPLGQASSRGAAGSSRPLGASRGCLALDNPASDPHVGAGRPAPLVRVYRANSAIIPYFRVLINLSSARIYFSSSNRSVTESYFLSMISKIAVPTCVVSRLRSK